MVMEFVDAGDRPSCATVATAQTAKPPANWKTDGFAFCRAHRCRHACGIARALSNRANSVRLAEEQAVFSAGVASLNK